MPISVHLHLYYKRSQGCYMWVKKKWVVDNSLVTKLLPIGFPDMMRATKRGSIPSIWWEDDKKSEV